VARAKNAKMPRRCRLFVQTVYRLLVEAFRLDIDHDSRAEAAASLFATADPI